MASNLVQRIGFAAVAIPLALGVVWLGGLPLVALICVAGALGTRMVETVLILLRLRRRK
jgi:hypothetical protein